MINTTSELVGILISVSIVTSTTIETRKSLIEMGHLILSIGYRYLLSPKFSKKVSIEISSLSSIIENRVDKFDRVFMSSAGCFENSWDKSDTTSTRSTCVFYHFLTKSFACSSSYNVRFFSG